VVGKAVGVNILMNINMGRPWPRRNWVKERAGRRARIIGEEVKEDKQTGKGSMIPWSRRVMGKKA